MSIKAIGRFFKVNKPSKLEENFFSRDLPLKQLPVLKRQRENYEVIVSEFSQGNKKLINIIKQDYSQHPVMTVVYNKIKQFVNGKLIASNTERSYKQSQNWFV